MSNKIKVNLENLNDDERETLMRPVEKANTPKNKVWKANKGEIYYEITATGATKRVKCNNDKYDDCCFLMGNMFKTREEAKFAAEKQKAIVELQRYAIEHNEGEIDWNDISECKYRIVYIRDDDKIDVFDIGFTKEIGQIYFTSQDIAYDAIQAIGEDRIKKYLFGVEE